jgi:predicted HicB family RNase H-like nuclease
MKHDKHDKSACSAQIMLRLPPPLREKIELRAAAEGRTLANMARRLLEAATAEHDAAIGHTARRVKERAA